MLILNRQAGFSLVEMMVAMVLGLLVILGAGQLFLTGLQSFRLVEHLNRVQEVVSYVNNVIGYELRQASAGTGPVESGSTAVVETSNRLLIRFPPSIGASYKPYCPSGTSEMPAIEYDFHSESGSIRVAATCDGNVVAPQPVVSGLSSVTFEADVASAGVVFVDVILEFSHGESFVPVSMRFARHSEEVFN